jgi:hypothetical protein
MSRAGRRAKKEAVEEHGSSETMRLSRSRAPRSLHRPPEFPNVYITCDSLWHPIAGDMFDLVIISETGYLFEEQVLRNCFRTLVARTEQYGVVLAAHWLGSSPDHVLGGDRRCLSSRWTMGEPRNLGRSLPLEQIVGNWVKQALDRPPDRAQQRWAHDRAPHGFAGSLIALNEVPTC